MFDGKLVIVTGASRGIGKAIALTLGRAGATVIGTATTESGAENISKVFADSKISGKGMKFGWFFDAKTLGGQNLVFTCDSRKIKNQDFGDSEIS